MVPLVVSEARTRAAKAALKADPIMLVWWATEVECASAIARLERAGDLATESTQAALARLDALAQAWHEVQPAESIRRTARRLLRVHQLRAGDSLQLAAALIVSEGNPRSLAIMSFDDRLVDAAQREGLAVLEAAEH